MIVLAWVLVEALALLNAKPVARGARNEFEPLHIIQRRIFGRSA